MRHEKSSSLYKHGVFLIALHIDFFYDFHKCYFLHIAVIMHKCIFIYDNKKD